MPVKDIVFRILRVLWDAIREFSNDYATHFAAAMAFYTIFAIAPLVLIVTALGGLIYGQEATRAEVISQIGRYVGPESKEVIVRLLENWQNPGAGITATIIGALTAIYFAFRVFDALRDSLNTIWGVRVRSNITWGQQLRKYGRSFMTMILVTPVFLASTLLSEVITRLGPIIERWLGVDLDIGAISSFFVGIVLLTLMFSIIYKWLPDIEIQWRDVWFGALVTALLFSLGRSLIAFYMARASTASLFGAAGSLVVLLFWIYYSAQILYFGAEVTEIYANRYGNGIRPDETAAHYGIHVDES